MSKATQRCGKGYFKPRDVHWPCSASCSPIKRWAEGTRRLCEGKQAACSSLLHCLKHSGSTALVSTGKPTPLYQIENTHSSFFHATPHTRQKHWTHPHTPKSLVLCTSPARMHTLPSKVPTALKKGLGKAGAPSCCTAPPPCSLASLLWLKWK